MSWLKSVILDLAVAGIVVIHVATGQSWARWVILIYTPFMLLLKLAAAMNAGRIKPMTGKKKSAPVAPDWFFHALYAATVALLAYDRWWLMAAAWVAIWAASFWYMRQMASKPGAA